MGRIRIAVLACLMAASSAQACINSEATDRQGRAFRTGGYTGNHLLSLMSEPFAMRLRSARVERIVAQARKQPDRPTLNELAVVLIRQGQYDAAIRLLLDVERLWPGHAHTAANLGTALELAGHDAAALRWIRLGVRRDAEEHYGSEWLHVRILEAKTGQRDVASISGLRFSSDLVPVIPLDLPRGNTRDPWHPALVAGALEYQLYERMGFVRAKDPIVATLLADWATLHLAGGSLETAQAAYAAALRYGYPQDELTRKRIAYVRDALADAKRRPRAGGECEICIAPPPPPPGT